MREKMTLIEMLIEAGYPQEQIYHHDSNLYIFVTPLTTKVLNEWCESNGWDKRLLKDTFLCSKFTDNITGEKMYDIAFQYTPYWEERLNHD